MTAEEFTRVLGILEACGDCGTQAVKILRVLGEELIDAEGKAWRARTPEGERKALIKRGDIVSRITDVVKCMVPQGEPRNEK